MAKLAVDAVLDAALNAVKAATKMSVCSAEPNSGAETATAAQITTVRLVEVAMTGTDFTGPANGTTSGRQLTVNAKNSVTVSGTGGTGLWVVLADASNMLYKTSCPSVTIPTTGTVNIGSWVIAIPDPT
jgi:hypothetical protein